MVLSLFKKKDKSGSENKNEKSRYLELPVKKIIRETEEAITIVFDDPENKVKYKPGQYLTLIFSIGEEEFRRSYSLCSSPVLNESPAVTVKRIEKGNVSNYIHYELKEGDKIKVLEPSGNFTTEFDKSNKRTLLLFAGGSGITPLMSILKTIVREEPQSQVILVYQNRNLQSIIYKKEIEELVNQYPDNLKVIHILSKPDRDWQGKSGRITAEMIHQIMDEEKISMENIDVFFCGPQGMMEIAETTMEKLGIDKNRRFKESFVSSPKNKQDKKSDDDSDFEESQVTILLDGEEHQIKVKPNEFILENALDADIDMPFSCQSGLCTTCRGKLLKGKVSMEEPDGLTDDEIKEGFVLTCVSHPASSEIKIEIG